MSLARPPEAVLLGDELAAVIDQVLQHRVRLGPKGDGLVALPAGIHWSDRVWKCPNVRWLAISEPSSAVGVPKDYHNLTTAL